MPAIRLGFPEIEGQLRNIRRRRNALTLQQALYLSGGGLLLIAALLVVLALRASTMLFTVGLWSAAVVIAVLLVGGSRYVWRNWLSVRRTVRWADETAQLDDRLATLIAHHRQPQPSRLTALVVTQLITLRHRWQPVALVPRRVPRSIYFFGVALLLLAATAFMERRDPPATPPAVHAGHGPEPRPEARHTLMHVSRSGHPGSADSAAGTGEGWDVVDDPGGNTQAAGGTSNSRQGATRPGARGAQPRVNSPASGRRSGPAQRDAAAMADASGGETTPDRMAERVQAMIRTAFGAQPVDMPPRTGQAQFGNKADPRHPGERSARPRSSGSGKSNETAETHPGERDRETDGAPHRRDTRAAERNQHEGDPQRGGAHASGAKAGSGTMGEGNPLGSSAAATGDPSLKRTFQLKLSALAVSLRSLTEPQKDAPPGSDPMPQTDTPPEGRLSDRDREDDTLVRTDIAPEHEAIVKRIFSHAEE